ncbi:hypothetical protein PsAD37_03645 [Pseudovibrio sp. Ad37]|nr:hypothetical protein PsAD37_03645 [Pseudovibrio sp. Ad37]
MDAPDFEMKKAGSKACFFVLGVLLQFLSAGFSPE